ncbi:hypothetical protein ACFC1I_04680 [Microbacterium sp. NPDC056044]|uniref:hypothetical protein n=1 Tax=Microbacterium sp. NPDC056044 TaxID=3345690 RepID=UPI0035DE8504
MSASFTTTWVPVEIDEPEPTFVDGIQCRWQADPTVGTDNILAYAWAPAERSDWDALVAEHTNGDGSTWFVESEERGEYLTHKTEYWVQDDDGYGATYLFTGDAIIYAMTKAETNDVTGPPSARN